MREFRIRDGKIIAGLCTGMSKKYNLSLGILRIIMVILALMYGLGIVIYILGVVFTSYKENSI